MPTFTWLTLITCTCFAQCSNILLLFPLPERSHYILGSSLAKALTNRGHSITMVSPFAEKIPPKHGTYRDIQLSGLYEEMQEQLVTNKLNFFNLEEPNPFVDAIRLARTCTEIEAVFRHPNFKKLLNVNETFDVVIVEQFLNDALKALSTYFQAPLIVLSSTGPNFWINSLTGNPSPPSYIPDIMLPFFGKMTFFERLVNSCIHVLNILVYNFYVYPTQNEMIKKYIPNGPDIHDVLYNASITLLNSHPSTNQPVPEVPNMIEIGGFHIKPPQKLPEDLQKFLDDAKDGVIYFSMGSNVRSAQFPPEKRDSFLKAFANLKEKVLWKWEEDHLPEQPENVKIGKWLPQQDILAHQNIKLFITHGGLLSTTEAVYHGVPVLVIPIFGDQKLNAKLAVAGGYGRLLPFHSISEDSITKMILAILNNPIHKNNAITRSKFFHDRLVGPMKTATFWIEYVIRHKGAPHLKVAGVDLPWYQYYLIDVFVFVMGLALLSILIIYRISRSICRKMFLKKRFHKIKKH